VKGTVPIAATVFLWFSGAASAADSSHLLFTDNFESHTAGALPGAPWSEATFKSGAVIQVDMEGPFEITYINPADDPRNKAK
jgi:hypothetical protein